MYIEGLGRRKASVAKVYLKNGSGVITVNDKNYSEFFDREVYINTILEPLKLTDNLKNFDIKIKVKGGGSTGQAGAIRLAISRALINVDEKLKKALKEAGFLTRDSRVVERKKYGQPKARKRFQFSKR